jgi:hypothetical protein
MSEETQDGDRGHAEVKAPIAAVRAGRVARDLNIFRYVPVDRGDVRIPRIWLTFIASLIIHAAALWFVLPHLDPAHLSVDEDKPGKARPTLVTRLSPMPAPRTELPPPPAPRAEMIEPQAPRVVRPSPTPSPPPAKPRPPTPVTPPAPPRPTPPPVAAPSSPPVIAAPGPAAARPAPTPAPAATPPARPPAETDLASYIEARRRERLGLPPMPSPPPSPPAAETDTQRRDRIVAANLAPAEQKTFGYDPKRGGGVFQINTIGYDYAEFWFTGWDKAIGRRAKELYEVRKDGSTDVKLTMIRKMISIIRANVASDFVWVSDRLGQQVTLSALPADNAALEDFLMQEFFGPPAQPGRRR